MIKKYGRVFLGIFVFSLPLAVVGQTADITQLYAQIQALSQQVQALQQQIANTRQEVQTTRRELRATVHEFRSQLRLGMTSEEVKLLQEMLAADSAIYPEKLVTGYFGLLTKTALIRFQLKHGIQGVGEVGPQTRRALNAFLKKSTDARGAILGQTLNTNGSATSTTTATSTNDNFGAGREKILICHIPPGNPSAAHTVTIGAPALRAHLAHGDSVGSCTTGGGGTGTSTPDSIAPILSHISASSTASTTTHIVWTTNEPATGKVWYGALSSLDTASASFVTSAILTANHDLAISGLTASTTYYYIVQSKDATNNTATSSQYSFITKL